MEEKATLLFVDDEERVVNLLRMMFRATHEVHTATSGQQALEIIAAHNIHVIVSDQRMPGMLGVDLLSEVRKRSPATMRILLTGYSDLAAIVGSVNDGEVFRFINKPWDQAEIKDIIADAVEAARATALVALLPAEVPAQAASTGERPELLLLDDSPNHRQAMMHILGTDYTVRGASSIPEALSILEQHDIGVIVSEAVIGGRDAGELLRVLKQHYPSITTIMLTNSADADLVIKLINGAQIFRFAAKPIRASAFQLCVSAAMKEHYRFRANPALVSRHRVAPSKEPENEALVSSVVKSLSSLRSRFTRLMARH
jgi:DNA-binding NtrC family response regulator